MRSVDLETFQHRIKKTIKTTADYLGQPEFIKLVRACRLKPYSVFTNKSRNHKLEYWWVDEFGNSLKTNERRIQIVFDDPEIKHNTKVSTDLLFGLGIEQTIDQSKAVVFGPDHFVFYGHDEYFRCFEINQMVRTSTLKLGIENLLWAIKHIDHKQADKDGDWNCVIYKLPNPEIEQMIKEEYLNE